MYRGTTPEFIFSLPFKCSSIAKLNIAFSQNNKVVLNKSASDCEMSGNTISLRLSEEDTLSLDSRYRVEVQLRFQCGEKKYASDIYSRSVWRILNDGLLDDITSESEGDDI